MSIRWTSPGLGTIGVEDAAGLADGVDEDRSDVIKEVNAELDTVIDRAWLRLELELGFGLELDLLQK
jgi:hypothetical protein